jgi:hypothetical protein
MHRTNTSSQKNDIEQLKDLVNEDYDNLKPKPAGIKCRAFAQVETEFLKKAEAKALAKTTARVKQARKGKVSVGNKKQELSKSRQEMIDVLSDKLNKLQDKIQATLVKLEPLAVSEDHAQKIKINESILQTSLEMIAVDKPSIEDKSSTEEDSSLEENSSIEEDYENLINLLGCYVNPISRYIHQLETGAFAERVGQKRHGKKNPIIFNNAYDFARFIDYQIKLTEYVHDSIEAKIKKREIDDWGSSFDFYAPDEIQQQQQEEERNQSDEIIIAPVVDTLRSSSQNELTKSCYLNKRHYENFNGHTKYPLANTIFTRTPETKKNKFTKMLNNIKNFFNNDKKNKSENLQSGFETNKKKKPI